MGALWASALSLCVLIYAAQPAPDATKLLQEADRLAWLRAWSKAEPLFSQAQRIFAAQGDERNALYAEISAFRGRLPTMSVPEASARVAQYLDQPLVVSDDRLRLRALVIKGEIDEDLDPTLAGTSWRAVQEIAERLGDAAWANRARGELGLVAFLQGDVGGSVISLGQAVKIAQSTGDVASLVRWLTLFGHGYVQLGRSEEALDFYDRALKVAATVPELQFPLMAYVGRSNALIRLERLDEADKVLAQAAEVADKFGARGYQAQLLSQRALIAKQRNDRERALALLTEAMSLANAAGGNRIVAEIAIDTAAIERDLGRTQAAERTLQQGIRVARAMEERLLLPRLLAELAELRASQRRYGDAAALLDEAGDLLEGLFTSASSPWVQSRLVSGMDDVFVARIRLEAARSSNAGPLYSAIEQARARSLLELLVNRVSTNEREPKELREGHLRVAALQRRLLQTTDRAARARLLEQIFVAEEQLAPASTQFFDRARRGGTRSRSTLRDLQNTLQPDELFIEFALLNPRSFAVVVTKVSARVQRLPGRTDIEVQAESLLKRVRADEAATAEAAVLGSSLLGTLPELRAHRRLIVSADGALHQVPFELLQLDGQMLLDSKVLSYAPSGSVLAALRAASKTGGASRRALAISASPAEPKGVVASAKAITRSVYDLDAAQLGPLPSADDEARSVGTILGPAGTSVLIGPEASEAELKRQPLQEFQVLHFAVHGIPSSKFPARAALLVHPGGTEDGVLQAREILALRLNATLVTLSACDTGAGSVHGQDGAASLVRPFIAAGARAVVANLWAADDTFSLALMREFYRRLASGSDVAESLHEAKLQMLKTFGRQAQPNLWAGVLAYGDGRGVLTGGTSAAVANVELLSQSGSATAQSIEGVWKGVSVVVTGPNGYTIPNRLPMMIIYTKRHYSVLAQDGDGRQQPRQVPPPLRTPGKPTDAEKIALYELWAPVVADAGTYEVRGSTLIQRQIVSKAGTPIERTREVTIEDGGQTLVEITKGAPGQPDRETRRTFTRLE
jgi:CHAT domain-containing protein/tetratricopeptide (TPR) repeat protein